MKLELTQAVIFTEILIGFALVLQSVELLWLAPQMRLGRLFRLGQWVRLILALILVFSPNYRLLDTGALIAILTGLSLITSMSFGGTFNGGSDAMTLVVLIGLGITQLPSSRAPWVGLGYIAFQATLSYAMAGWVKLKERAQPMRPDTEPPWRRACRKFPRPKPSP